MKNRFLVFLLSALLATAAMAQVNPCDVNYDNKVNTADVVAIYNNIIDGTTPTKPAMERKTFTYNGVKFYFEPVEGGTFMMGATAEHEQMNYPEKNEYPVHEVTVSDFYMARTELTQAQWKAVASNDPFEFKGDNLPVESVSFNEALLYCLMLNVALEDQLPEGMIFRLPTEAEWEYAARGGKKSVHWQYSGKYQKGTTRDDYMWYNVNGSKKTHNVGTKLPNELGLYDMSGNVAELCWDYYGGYGSDAQTDPAGPASGSKRVYRGGSFGNSNDWCRTSLRVDREPTYKDEYTGFRLVLARPISE